MWVTSFPAGVPFPSRADVLAAVNKAGNLLRFADRTTGTLITSGGVEVLQYASAIGANPRSNTVVDPFAHLPVVNPPGYTPNANAGPAALPVADQNPAQQQQNTASQPSALESLLSQIMAPLQQIADSFKNISERVTNTAKDLGAFTAWATGLHTLERIAAIAMGMLLLGTGLAAFLSSFVNWSDVASTAQTAVKAAVI